MTAGISFTRPPPTPPAPSAPTTTPRRSLHPSHRPTTTAPHPTAPPHPSSTPAPPPPAPPTHPTTTTTQPHPATPPSPPAHPTRCTFTTARSTPSNCFATDSCINTRAGLRADNQANASARRGNSTHSTCRPSDTAAPHPLPSGSDSNPPTSNPDHTAGDGRRQTRRHLLTPRQPRRHRPLVQPLKPERRRRRRPAHPPSTPPASHRSAPESPTPTHRGPPHPHPAAADHSNNNHPGRTIAASRNLGNNGVAS